MRKKRTRRLLCERLAERLLMTSVGWDGSGAGSANLTYYIGSIPDEFTLTEEEVVATIEEAFAVWSDVVDLTIERTDRPRLRDSIDIRFNNIDGNGQVLGEAYPPDDLIRSRIAGDITFDSSETWEIGNQDRFRAIDFKWVAVHEIGHALGLEHTTDRTSVMFDSVGPSQQFSDLSQTDIDDILMLYAEAPAPIRGDLTGDDLVDERDIDRLNIQINFESEDSELSDLDDDGVVDTSDRDVLVTEILDTTYGDADLNGVFDSGDLVTIFQANTFEDSDAPASWSTGDWNGDGLFDTSDLILAFQAGEYQIA